MRKLNLGRAALCLAIAFAAASAYPQQTITISTANNFLNSFGVNAVSVPPGGGTQWGHYLSYLGMRHFRDDLLLCSVSDLVAEAQASGATADVTMGGPGPNGPADLTTFLNDAVTLANAGALLSLEGPNEPYWQPVTWNGSKTSNTASPYWDPVAYWQQSLYSQAKRNPTLKNYPILSVSLSGFEANDVGLQWQTIPSNPPDAGTLVTSVSPIGTHFATMANEHLYPGDGVSDAGLSWAPLTMFCAFSITIPGCSAPNAPVNYNNPYYDLEYTTSPTGSNAWGQLYAGYTASQAEALPRATTESGLYEGEFGFTDAQIGKTYLNAYLDSYVEGWSYLFLFNMVDGGNGYGLMNSNGTYRKQGTFIHNFTRILADTSTSFTPTQIYYSLSGDTNLVFTLQIEKSNGAQYLVVWDEQVPTATTPSQYDNVTVSLSGTHNVTEYDPTVGTSATATFRNVSSVNLPLWDHPVILKIE